MLHVVHDKQSETIVGAGCLLDEDIAKLEEVAREIEAQRSGEYHASEEELRAIDEAIAELERGGVASEAQVRAAFAKFRSA